MNMKLRSLVEGFINKDEWTLQEKKEALAMIGKYNEYGRALRREQNLMQIAETLSQIAKSAERFTMNETIDDFDKKTVTRNMDQLSRCSSEFNKLAKDSYVVEQRMQALYEDMGLVLDRYFSIKDDVVESKVEASEGALSPTEDGNRGMR